MFQTNRSLQLSYQYISYQRQQLLLFQSSSALSKHRSFQVISFIESFLSSDISKFPIMDISIQRIKSVLIKHCIYCNCPQRVGLFTWLYGHRIVFLLSTMVVEISCSKVFFFHFFISSFTLLFNYYWCTFITFNVLYHLFYLRTKAELLCN